MKKRDALAGLVGMVVTGALALTAPACGSDGQGEAGEGGTGDAGGHHKPSKDAGAPLDSAPPTDSPAVIGDNDAAEGGRRDGGPPPSPSKPAIACTDPVADVYVTPSGLKPMTLANRGDIVACAPDSVQSLSTVTSNVTAASVVGFTATSGVNIYRIEYRTKRANGTDGTSSARVYLPQTPKSSPLPVLIVAHPTQGMAASCAPSMTASSNANLALPWAGLGYAVIAPDYAGLGTQGVQGYVDNVDTAQSMMDGARALYSLIPGAFDERVLAIGYSQGGGAVLSVQALAKSYGVGGNLIGVIGFAPEWPSRLDSFNYIKMLQDPTELSLSTGLMEPVVASYVEYQYFANYVSLGAAGDGLPDGGNAAYVSAITSLCFEEFGAWVFANQLHVEDLINDNLRTTLLSCVSGADGGADSGCVDPGKSYYEYLKGNILTEDSKGAPVLYVQGLADTIMPPASEAACNILKMEADGLTPQLCTDPTAEHTTVVQQNIMFAIQWGEAVLDGKPLPTCSSAGMPTCTP
jgi:hypothetical protein